MPSPMLRLLPWLLLACADPLSARTLSARIDRVHTEVATLEGVRVRLDWPAQAAQGELLLSAERIVAPDLGYRYADVSWRCPLRRSGQGGWQCDGELASGQGKPLRLSLALGTAVTDAKLSHGNARLALHRQASTPDLTTFDLTRVPVAWAQALATQAWRDARLKSGVLDGRLAVTAATGQPLRVGGTLALSGVALDTPDGSIAAEHVAGKFDIDYRKGDDRAQAIVAGALHDGEFLVGNAYVVVPDTPVALRVEAHQSGDAGWQLPRLEWRDGAALQVSGSAALTPAGALRDLDLEIDSRDVAPLRPRYLSGWLGLAGLSELELDGAFDARLRLRDGILRVVDARLEGVTMHDGRDRFGFEGLDGTVRYSADAPVTSELRWRSGDLQGLDFGAATLPFDSHDGTLHLRQPVDVPMLGGRFVLESMELQPPDGTEGLRIGFGMTLDRIDIAEIAKALQLPAFTGELSGYIPSARYANDRIDFDGGLVLQLFQGHVQVSSLAMERPFGVAPTLSADVALRGIDLQALTGVFDVGSVSGRLDGQVDNLRLVDWSPTAFEAEFHTVPTPGVRQRLSQRAVQNISSVGDASFVGSLQGQLIGLFDDFGYSRIGISCRLANEVCEMGGLHPAGDGFTLIEGAGIPRLNVVGYNRNVDWPTLIERAAAVGKGDIKPVVK